MNLNATKKNWSKQRYNRAEGYGSKGKNTTAKQFYAKSESHCEDALEILQEILYSDPYLKIWFDREVSFEFAEGLIADIVSLPRLITSRSIERLRGESRIFSKLDVKLSVLERAIHNIGRDTHSAPNDMGPFSLADSLDSKERVG